MDLTFQVPMQYCSSQHWTLLPSPVTSIMGHCFCFGSISSFFLELFLYSSPVAYWASTHLESSPFSVCLFAFSSWLHGVLKARILEWFAIPFSSGPLFVRPLHHDPLSWVALHGMAHSFIELDKAVTHVIRKTLYSQQKQDQELTVAQIMNSLLKNSDLNWRK